MNYSGVEIAEMIKGEIINPNTISIHHVSTDSRSVQNSENSVFFALTTKKRDGHNFISELIERGVKTFVVSSEYKEENSSVSFIKVSNTLEALQKLAEAHRAKFQLPVIAITGSYGKTMVKEWLYQLLSPEYTICRSPKSFNSQLGVPLSVLLLNESHNLAIFEAGISQVGEMERLEKIIKPTFGVFTKIGEAHQSGFNSREKKIIEKRILFKNVEELVELSAELPPFSYPFKDGASQQNCGLCALVMQKLGYSDEIIQQRLLELTPLALRLEMKKGRENSTIINDGYNISYSSLVLSMEFLNAQAKQFKKTAILSELPETSFEDEKLVKLLNSSDLSRVLVVGEKKIKGLNSSVLVHYFSTTQELLQELSQYSFRDQFVLIKGSRIHRLEQVAQALEEKNHRTVLEIDLSQLSKNLVVYRKKIKPSTKLMAMVKAFSYGSGTVEIPSLLEQEGVDYLGVAYTDEGIHLRNGGIKMPIIVMNPEPGSFFDLIQYDLEPEIYSLQELDEFVKGLIVANKKEYPIHIKLETGMNRLGFLNQEIPELISYINSQPEVYVKSVFSHLSSADELQQRKYTLNQLECFELYSSQLIKGFSYPIDRHVLNTAGIENYIEYEYNMVRLGIGLYGINLSKKESEIKPISRLKSVVIQTKKLKKDDSIGYGRKTIAQQEMEIAIVPIGYSDGLRRSLGNRKFSFFVNGNKCDIVGNLCMDITMIEITGLGIKVGDEVEIFGKYNSVEDLSVATDTIPYEVLTSISQRVKRVFYKD